MTKKKQTYPVREPTADDALELFGILGAAGIDGQTGQAVGLAIAAFSSEERGSRDVMVQAAAQAVTSGLSAALRDREARDDAKRFIYSIWQPKLGVAQDDDEYEQKKREAWRKLPMRAPIEIIESFRKTDNFADFLSFFTDMLPGETSETTSGESSTSSKETTATGTENS